MTLCLVFIVFGGVLLVAIKGSESDHPLQAHSVTDTITSVFTILCFLILVGPRALEAYKSSQAGSENEFLSQNALFMSSASARACMWLFAVATQQEGQIEFLDAVDDFERMPPDHPGRSGKANQTCDKFLKDSGTKFIKEIDDL